MTLPTSIGFVGTGDMGAAVARLAAAAGFEVHLSNSRGPDTLADFAAELGPNAHASTVEDAITASELVVVSIPFGRFRDLPAERFEERIVIDTTNYIPFRDTAVADLLDGSRTPSELLQNYLSPARVVKTISNIYSGHLQSLARPSAASDRSALPIAGDDAEAKGTVTEFLDRIGWDTVDAGPLPSSILFNVGTPVFVKAYMADASGTDNEWGARITTDPGKPLSRNNARALIGAEWTRTALLP